MSRKKVAGLLLLVNCLLYSENLWEIAVRNSPEKYFIGSVTQYEDIYDEEGELSDSSIYQLIVNDEMYIKVSSAVVNDKKLNGGKLKKLEEELNSPELKYSDFDPLLLEVQEYIKYKAVNSNKYGFSFKYEEISIEGFVYIDDSGIPEKSEFLLTSVPVIGDDYKLLSSEIVNFYTEAKDGRWNVSSVMEETKLEVEYFFLKFPILIKTRYIFNYE